MMRTCDICLISYDAKRPSSKYCSDSCRKRAQRAPVAPVVPLTVVTSMVSSDGPLFLATSRELEAVDQLASSLGQSCLLIARRLDEGLLDTGGSIAALVREHRATLAEAVASGRVAADPLDQIAARRQIRLARG